MKAHSDALRRRWEDPAYREKQTETNRRTNEQRKAYFADPLARKRHGAAVRIGYRIRRQGKP
jgi:hypothetical protein